MHSLNCDCSVCWAHLFADALKLFSYTEEENPPLPPDYYRFVDCTAEFKRENHTSDAVERSKSDLFGRDLSAPYRFIG